MIVLAAAQSSIVPSFRLNSGQPDLIFLVVVAWSVRATWGEGIFWAFAGGIAHDLLSLVPLGTSVITLLVALYVIKSVEDQIYSFHPILLLPLVLFGTILNHLLLFLALSVLKGYAIDLIPTIRYFTLPTLFYHVVLIFPVYVIVRLFQSRIAMTPQTGF